MSEPITKNDARPALQHWGVDVRVNGEGVLTIESNCLYGKHSLSPRDLDAIRTAAHHLLAFAGRPSLHRMNQFMQETAPEGENERE